MHNIVSYQGKQIKTIMRYHRTLSRIAKIQKANNITCWYMGLLYTEDGKAKQYTLEKIVLQFLIKSNIKYLHDRSDPIKTLDNESLMSFLILSLLPNSPQILNFYQTALGIFPSLRVEQTYSVLHQGTSPSERKKWDKCNYPYLLPLNL